MDNGKVFFNQNIFDITVRTYPDGGWNYIQGFKTCSYPVNIIIGNHDWLDFGNGLIKKWVGEVPRVQLSIIEEAMTFG